MKTFIYPIIMPTYGGGSGGGDIEVKAFIALYFALFLLNVVTALISVGAYGIARYKGRTYYTLWDYYIDEMGLISIYNIVMLVVHALALITVMAIAIYQRI